MIKMSDTHPGGTVVLGGTQLTHIFAATPSTDCPSCTPSIKTSFTRWWTRGRCRGILRRGKNCSHFYGWKIAQEFEHKFLGVWLKYPWICLENQWILVQIFLVDPWVDPWINPWVHLGNSVPVRGRMQSVSVSLINYTFWLSFWAKVNFDWARKVPITDAKWQYSAQ